MAPAAKPTDDGSGVLVPPRHVAIIMDGNGRWARERGLPRALGHRQGVEAVRRAVRAAIELKITYLTIFSFSSENWNRPVEEVDDLMGLMKRFIRRDLAELHEAGVCIRVIGQRQHVDNELTTLIDEAVELTRGNDVLTLVIAFNYGSRTEIAGAARKLAEQVAAGELDPSEITVERIANALDTSGIPDPDLLIRTSGEMRLSNFLLWQTAYSEFVFLDCYWPDFDKAAFEVALAEFRSRERRFGGLSKRSTA
ncbi:isoprenyl transferase [Hyphomicrobium sp. ghe19]|uniref:isoprenyl transferase n=1 Tax=Hyphomicrobium sp. ghe19 TaxID=2682968 RepID=UPI0013677835|nr:Ditrans,polycis-undecaprenyl-diphosphate synthase ((2E,6E)-farnesyl-diphosphate specific) [Hyphomicrobium sp. ghe19]